MVGLMTLDIEASWKKWSSECCGHLVAGGPGSMPGTFFNPSPTISSQVALKHGRKEYMYALVARLLCMKIRQSFLNINKKFLSVILQQGLTFRHSKAE